MQNTERRLRKQRKKKNLRKDFERRKNIRKNPPSIVREFDVKVTKQVKGEEGKNITFIKKILKRIKRKDRKTGKSLLFKVEFPKSKKYKLNKTK